MKNSSVQLQIESGSKYAKAHLELDPGKVVSCALYAIGTPSHAVQAQIKSKKGDEITPLLPFQDFKPTNGDYLTSRKPLTANVRNVVIELYATENLTSDFIVDFVFDIENESNQ